MDNRCLIMGNDGEWFNCRQYWLLDGEWLMVDNGESYPIGGIPIIYGELDQYQPAKSHGK